MKRYRRRDYVTTLDRPYHTVDSYSDVRSAYARAVMRSVLSADVSFSSISRDRLYSDLVRRQDAVRPARVRLRTSPMSISPTYLAKLPHGTKREALSCVRTELKKVRANQGAGVSNRRSKNRQEQRRQIFQAVRKSC